MRSAAKHRRHRWPLPLAAGVAVFFASTALASRTPRPAVGPAELPTLATACSPASAPVACTFAKPRAVAPANPFHPLTAPRRPPCGLTTVRVPWGERVVEEDVLALDGTVRPRKRLYWGNGIDELAAYDWDGDLDGTLETRLYPLQDDQGTVHAVADGDGVITESYLVRPDGTVQIYGSDRTPPRPAAPRAARRPGVAFHPWYGVGVLQLVISELNNAACTLAVDASLLRSPSQRTTRFRPAASLSGWASTHRARSGGFGAVLTSALGHLVPLLQGVPDAHQVPQIVHSSSPCTPFPSLWRKWSAGAQAACVARPAVSTYLAGMPHH